MKLVVYCKNCSYRNTLNIKASDRVTLKMKYGKYIEVTCKKCHVKKKYDIDEIKAEQRYCGFISFVIIILSMFSVVYYLWDYISSLISSAFLLPAGLFIIFLFYVVFLAEMNKKIKYFNRS